MDKTFKRVVKKTYETIVKSVNKNISLVAYKENCKIVNTYFYKNEYLSFGKTNIKIKKGAESFNLFKSQIIDEMNNKPFQDIDHFKYEYKSKEIFELENIDINDLLLINRSSHLVYKINSKYPISSPYIINSYMHRDKYYDIDNLEKFLKTLSCVSNINVTDVPYYNANFEGERKIKFIVKLEQDIFNKYWDIAVNVNPKYPSCDLINSIEGLRDDILDINKFRK